MIDGLLATLERDAAAEIARIEAEGRSAAQGVDAAAGQRIDERRQAALAACEAENRAVQERAFAAARYAARERVLRSRAAFLNRVFDAIQKILPEVAASDAYQAALATEYEQAVAFTAGRPAVVRCAPGLESQLRRIARANGRLKIATDRSIQAGFRVATRDGGLEVDATLEGRIQRLHARLALEALAGLPPPP